MTKQSVSSKNTKQEILSAYEKLTAELEHRDQQSELRLEAESKTHEIPSQKPEQIVSRLGELRVAINKNLGEIVDKLVEESEKVQEMKEQADKIRKEIETMHKITVHASTLQNILKLKEEEEIQLENTISTKRTEWKQEQDLHDKEHKEWQAELIKFRKRDEEEYAYHLKMKRKKEEDEYQIHRNQIEKALKIREEQIVEKEDVFKFLQKQVADLEKKLETDIVKARKETSELITRDLKTAYNLEQKELEGERKINKLTIDNLQKTISSQQDEIKELKQQLTRATQQIKDIAISVIESKRPAITLPINKEEK